MTPEKVIFDFNYQRLLFVQVTLHDSHRIGLDLIAVWMIGHVLFLLHANPRANQTSCEQSWRTFSSQPDKRRRPSSPNLAFARDL